LSGHKIIQDSVHGSVRLDGVFLSLIEAPELQRLHSIHQLGLAYLVYPGANHTRFEHSLGTYAVAGRICSALQLDPEEADLVKCAALLHDVGHLPYSHTFEVVLHDRFGIDHAEISRRLVRGEETVLSEAEMRILGDFKTINAVLEDHDIDAEEVARLLEFSHGQNGPQRTLSGRDEGQTFFNERRYLSQIVGGTIDADQLDYLVRDSHYTGVAYGVIDLDRLLETIQIFNGDLVIEKGGLSAVEGMLVARALMFSSVYFHKTVRISELMLAKAVELLGKKEIGDIHKMTDASLLGRLTEMGGYFEEIATEIKYRQLFKKAYAIPVHEVGEEEWESIDEFGEMGRRRKLEQDIARRAGTDPGHVIVDVPSSELTISEPRISLTDVRILDGTKVRLLPRMSSIASSLHTRRVHEWAVMVACPAKDREKVAKAAKKVLGL